MIPSEGSVFSLGLVCHLNFIDTLSNIRLPRKTLRVERIRRGKKASQWNLKLYQDTSGSGFALFFWFWEGVKRARPRIPSLGRYGFLRWYWSVGTVCLLPGSRTCQALAGERLCSCHLVDNGDEKNLPDSKARQVCQPSIDGHLHPLLSFQAPCW